MLKTIFAPVDGSDPATGAAGLILICGRGLGDLKGPLPGGVSHKGASLVPCTCIMVK